VETRCRSSPASLDRSRSGRYVPRGTKRELPRRLLRPCNLDRSCWRASRGRGACAGRRRRRGRALQRDTAVVFLDDAVHERQPEAHAAIRRVKKRSTIRARTSSVMPGPSSPTMNPPIAAPSTRLGSAIHLLFHLDCRRARAKPPQVALASPDRAESSDGTTRENEYVAGRHVDWGALRSSSLREESSRASQLRRSP
jgi:hypothetical protein